MTSGAHIPGLTESSFIGNVTCKAKMKKCQSLESRTVARAHRSVYKATQASWARGGCAESSEHFRKYSDQSKLGLVSD